MITIKTIYINRIACTKKVSGNGMASQNHWGTQINMANNTTVETINRSQEVVVDVFSVFILRLNFFCAAKVERMG